MTVRKSLDKNSVLQSTFALHVQGLVHSPNDFSHVIALQFKPSSVPWGGSTHNKPVTTKCTVKLNEKTWIRCWIDFCLTIGCIFINATSNQPAFSLTLAKNSEKSLEIIKQEKFQKKN